MNEIWTKAKLDSLFFRWVSSTQGSSQIRHLVEECKQGRSLCASSTASPSSSSATTTTTTPTFRPKKKLSPSQSFGSPVVVVDEGKPQTPPTPTRKMALVKKISPLSLSSPVQTSSSSIPFDKSELSLPSKPAPPSDLVLASRLPEIEHFFSQFGQEGVPLEHFSLLCSALLSLPLCLVVPLFRRIRFMLRRWNRIAPATPSTSDATMQQQPSLPLNPAWMSEESARSLLELEEGSISCEDFCFYWKQEIEPFVDGNTRLFRLLKSPDAEGIYPSDLFVVLKELIDTHPGLEFLETAPEFQEKYARTVVARIFQRVNVSLTGCITLRELSRSDFLVYLDLVSNEDEINNITEYFSYEHFYVIFCKFWELDVDHDFSLSKEEFARFGAHSLTRGIVDRIFAQSSRKFTSGIKNRMGYEDFCLFLLCEEDKSTESSIRYWFDLMDLNMDGKLDPWEVKVFYDEQQKRMNHLHQEEDVGSLEDVLCMMKDALGKGQEDWHITVRECLAQSALCGHFFNQLFNLTKFIAFETRDPFARLKMLADGLEVTVMSDWDKFALTEYAKLASVEEAKAATSTSSSSATTTFIADEPKEEINDATWSSSSATAPDVAVVEVEEVSHAIDEIEENSRMDNSIHTVLPPYGPLDIDLWRGPNAKNNLSSLFV